MKKSKKKPTKLVGSADTVEQLKELACRYFCTEIKFVLLSDNSMDVHNSRGKIDGLTVVLKDKRYRLERFL